MNNDKLQRIQTHMPTRSSCALYEKRHLNSDDLEALGYADIFSIMSRSTNRCFYRYNNRQPETVEPDISKVSLQSLAITESQASLEVKSVHTQLSPYLEMLSISECYASWTSAQAFCWRGWKFHESTALSSSIKLWVTPLRGDEDHPIEEISIDGGKARIQTPRGRNLSMAGSHGSKPSWTLWQKRVLSLRPTLMMRVNQQQLSPLPVLGRWAWWNLFPDIGTPHQRHKKILDWFRLGKSL